MKSGYWFMIGFMVASILALIIFRQIHNAPSGSLNNDSLNVAHNETQKIIAGVDSLENSDSIRVLKTDSAINKKYENIPLSLLNFYIDSLQREQLRTIKRLDKRRCPY